MAADRNPHLVFGRYTREQIGLPPLANTRSRLRRGVLGCVAVLVCLTAAGWFAGLGTARWRLMWLESLPFQIRASAPDAVPGLLATGRLYAASQPDSAAAGRSMVLALMAAAEQSPRRMGYYGSAGAILDDMDLAAGTPEAAFAAHLAAATVKTELAEYNAAFRLLAGADKALAAMPETAASRARRLLLVNMQSYLLAIVPPAEGGNPEKALHLAQLLLTSRDQITPGLHASDSAAFLDTLACAWHAAGSSDKATKTQRLALGLAEAEGLDVYIRHFDEFAAAPKPARPTRPAEPGRIAMANIRKR